MGFLFGMLTVVSLVAILYFFGYIEFNFGQEIENEHEHDWVVRGAHQLFRVRTYHGIPITPIEEGAPITEVLYRCDCGAVETGTEEGHWTFEQLSGVAGSGETIEADEEFGAEPIAAESETGKALREAADRWLSDRTANTQEFCGLESLHGSHEYDGGKHCPGSLRL